MIKPWSWIDPWTTLDLVGEAFWQGRNEQSWLLESVISREQWGRSRLSGDAFADPPSSSEREDHIGMGRHTSTQKLRLTFGGSPVQLIKVAGILLPRVLSDQMSVAWETSEDIGRHHTTSTDGGEILINAGNQVNANRQWPNVWGMRILNVQTLNIKHLDVVRHADWLRSRHLRHADEFLPLDNYWSAR